MNLGPLHLEFASWLADRGVWWPELVAALLLVGGPVFGIVFPVAAVAQYFERKIAALVQRRRGPSAVGAEGPVRAAVHGVLWFLPRWRRETVFHFVIGLPLVAPILRLVRHLGLGQIAADGIKMFTKEDIFPDAGDRVLFTGSTLLGMAAAFAAFAVFPWSQNLHSADWSVAVLWVLSLSGFTAIALLMAGWGSNNKWSLMGGLRAAAQVVSFEVPLGLVIACVALWSGTLSLQGIVSTQFVEGPLSFLGWNLFQNPFFVALAAVHLTAGLAVCNRAPFDLPEAESELVGGFHTEYSGLRWGLFFIAEYAEMFLFGGLFAVFFLGGYQSPFFEEQIVAFPPLVEAMIHTAILTVKCLMVIGFFMWVRWTLPRFRVDRAMRLAWTRLVPVGIACLAGLAVLLVLSTNGEPARTVVHGRMVTHPFARPDTFEVLLAWGILMPLIAAGWWRLRREPTPGEGGT